MNTISKKSLYLALLGAASVSQAMAQDAPQRTINTNLYGLLDAGVSSVSNQNGKSVTRLDDGIYTPSLLGVRGDIQLDGGLQAVFTLETQIDVGSGNTIPNSSMFWRQSYIGLASEKWGTLTLGTQMDFMWDSLAPALNDPALVAGGLYNFSGGPFSALGIPKNPTGGMGWDRTEAARLNNTAKYQSPTMGGFSIGALYGFHEDDGDRSASAGMRYERGAAGFGAAYTKVDYRLPLAPEVSIRNWGVGGHYKFDSLILSALASSARNVQSGAEVRQVRMGGKWDISGPWSLGLVYSYMDGNRQLNDNHAHQVGATLSYAFLNNARVYVQGVYQKTNDGANAHIMGIMTPFGASSTSSQSIVRVGMQLGF